MKRICALCFISLYIFPLCSLTISWTASEDPLSSSDQNASNPQLAMDASGNLVAAWIENGIAIAKTKLLDGNWSDPSTITTGDPSSIRLVVDPNGNATAMWIETGRVKTADLPFQSVWSAPIFLSSEGASSPQLVSDDSGNLVSVWVQNGVIQSATKLFSGNWPDIPDDLSSANADAPQVALSASGKVIAVWQGTLDTVNAIFSCNKMLSGAWNDPTTISNPTQNSVSPQVSIDPLGNALAAWYRYDVSNEKYSNVIVQYSLCQQDGPWSTPADLSSAGIRNPKDLVLQIACTNPYFFLAAWSNSYDGATFTVEGSLNISGYWIQNINLVNNNIYAYDFNIIAEKGYGFGVFMLNDSLSSSVIVQYSQTNTFSSLNNLFPPKVLSQGETSGYPKIAATLRGNTEHLAAIWLSYNGENTVIESAIGLGYLIDPPSNLAVEQNLNNLGIFTEYYNTISWTNDSMNNSDVAGFFIFRNGILIGSGAPSVFEFIDHNRIEHEPVTYGIAFYDYFGNQSSVATVSFPE